MNRRINKETILALLNRETALSLLLVLFFLNAPIMSVATAVVGSILADIFINIVMLALLVFCCKGKTDNVKKCLWIYGGVAVIIVLTIFFHPEYGSWYTHERYGIMRQFLNLRGGIWALLILSLYNDREKLVKDLRIVVLLIFLAYFGKFLVASFRGYWITTDIYGKQMKATYDMEFGYRMLFCAAYWGALGILRGEWRYKILYAVASLLIVLGGSRAPFIWTLTVPVIAVAYEIVKVKKIERIKKVAYLAAYEVVAVLFVMNMGVMMTWVNTAADKIAVTIGITEPDDGTPSDDGTPGDDGLTTDDEPGEDSTDDETDRIDPPRTVTSFTEGTLLESKGRSAIYKMSANLIKTGGPFGRGFYGDRTTIGERFRWGYSHNIFLELLVSFGYIGGSLAILLLLFLLVRIFIKAKSNTDRIVFITFAVSAFKLLLSSSFWYEPSFWVLLAMAVIWKWNSETPIVETAEQAIEQ